MWVEVVKGKNTFKSSIRKSILNQLIGYIISCALNSKVLQGRSSLMCDIGSLCMYWGGYRSAIVFPELHSVFTKMFVDFLTRLPRLWKTMKASNPVFAVTHLQNMIAIYNGQSANERAVGLIIVRGVCVTITPPRTVWTASL